MLKRINQVEPNITSVDINKINEYLDSGGWITEHNVTRNLEDRISSLLNRKYAVAVPNGTIAIYLSLLSAGIEKGSRVAVPNITMIATINAVLWAGATPVLIDVDETLSMSLESLKEIDNLNALIFVPLNGRSGQGIEIDQYCDENQILMIEDSAHALGSNYENISCGSIGKLSILSFTPHKIITMGQGGMVLLDDDEIYENLIDLKTFNREKDKSDWHKGFGLNFKITDLQASLGLSQFDRLNEFINIKKTNQRCYENNLKNLKNFKTISFQDYETPWFHDLICSSEKIKNDLSDYLASNNIETRNSYPALSFQSYLNDIEKSKVEYSEKISNNVLWLPSSTNLKQQDIDFICELIQKFDNEVAV